MRRGYLQLEDGRDDHSTDFVRCNAAKESAGCPRARIKERLALRVAHAPYIP